MLGGDADVPPMNAQDKTSGSAIARRARRIRPPEWARHSDGELAGLDFSRHSVCAHGGILARVLQRSVTGGLTVGSSGSWKRLYGLFY